MRTGLATGVFLMRSDPTPATLAATMSDEELLLALLNANPVVDVIPTDDLEDRHRDWTCLASAGGQGTDPELRHVREVRAMLQAIVRERSVPPAPHRSQRGPHSKVVRHGHLRPTDEGPPLRPLDITTP